jgi:hypothetical protein
MSCYPAGFSIHKHGDHYSSDQLGLKTRGGEATLQKLNEVISVVDACEQKVKPMLHLFVRSTNLRVRSETAAPLEGQNKNTPLLPDSSDIRVLIFRLFEDAFCSYASMAMLTFTMVIITISTTPAGKVVAGMAAISGVILLSLPITIVGTKLLEECKIGSAERVRTLHKIEKIQLAEDEVRVISDGSPFIPARGAKGVTREAFVSRTLLLGQRMGSVRDLSLPP